MLKTVMVNGGAAGTGDVLDVDVDLATVLIGRSEAVEIDANPQSEKTRVIDVSDQPMKNAEPVSLQTKRRGSRSRAQ